LVEAEHARGCRVAVVHNLISKARIAQE